MNRDNLKVLLKILTGVPFTNIDITSPDLEEIFLKYYNSESDSNQNEEALAWEGI
ncbi:MAG: hypothetical protein ACXADD_17735 [Candidatus Thorarchaeota archaeon]